MNVKEEVSIGEENFETKVCLKYTYGQPVPGSVTVKVCRPVQKRIYNSEVLLINPEELQILPPCETVTKQVELYTCSYTYAAHTGTCTKMYTGIMVWDCCPGIRLGPFVLVKLTLNALKYQDIWNNFMLPLGMTLFYSNTTEHKAKFTKTWMNEFMTVQSTFMYQVIMGLPWFAMFGSSDTYASTKIPFQLKSLTEWGVVCQKSTCQRIE
ncbi:hypothetical protein AMECASPLE_035842 [Ameca splendens]|uniref:Macroglobulin domain-containing protein n=1 Tax=Ameca splendens TaxID=208324 RepID=A0ABV0ZG84_9TELE